MAISFKGMIKEMEKQKSTLPTIIGNMAKNHFQNNFRLGGFMDASLEPWASRKTKNSSDRNAPKKVRAILVDTGHGRGSISIGVANWTSIEIVTKGITYLHYHNVGDTRDGVQRKFMGESHTLNVKIRERIRKEIGRILALKA